MSNNNTGSAVEFSLKVSAVTTNMVVSAACNVISGQGSASEDIMQAISVDQRNSDYEDMQVVPSGLGNSRCEDMEVDAVSQDSVGVKNDDQEIVTALQHHSQQQDSPTEIGIQTREALNKDNQEMADKPLKAFVEASKRRRRSTLVISTNIVDDTAAVSTFSAGKDEIAVESPCSARRSETRCRSGLSRRSVCAVLPPQLTIADQVSRVTMNGDSTSILSQLLDISIRDSLCQFAANHSNREQYMALKGVVLLNSEQLADETSKQLAAQKMTLEHLLSAAHGGSSGGATESSSTSGAATGDATTGDATAGDAASGGATTGDATTAACTGGDVDTARRKLQDDNSELLHNRRLLAEYSARQQRLHEEYRRWKQIKRQRRDAHTAAKREWAEAMQGGCGRLGEEQQHLLSSVHRTFLAGHPDHGRLWAGLGTAVENSLAFAALYERAVVAVTALADECVAAADEAYLLIDATMHCSPGTMCDHLRALGAADTDVAGTV